MIKYLCITARLPLSISSGNQYIWLLLYCGFVHRDLASVLSAVQECATSPGDGRQAVPIWTERHACHPLSRDLHLQGNLEPAVKH